MLVPRKSNLSVVHEGKNAARLSWERTRYYFILSVDSTDLMDTVTLLCSKPTNNIHQHTGATLEEECGEAVAFAALRLST